jgi:iron complex transport system substrate-binding protein
MSMSAIAAIAASALVACGRVPDAPSAAARLRIVSLSPALTHTVEALGGAPAIVGCTPWCGAAGARVVGSLEDRDLEAIAALRPTAVLRQARDADPALERVAASVGATVQRWRLDSVADVRDSLEPLAELLAAGGIDGARDAAARVVAAHEQALRPTVQAAGAVLFVFSLDPPTAFGAGTYVDDLWRAMGGRNAIERPGYPALTAEDVLRMAPTALVLVGTAAGTAAPGWWTSTGRPFAAIAAPELLEPSARMLVSGPESLRAADRIVASPIPAKVAAP